MKEEIIQVWELHLISKKKREKKEIQAQIVEDIQKLSSTPSSTFSQLQKKRKLSIKEQSFSLFIMPKNSFSFSFYFMLNYIFLFLCKFLLGKATLDWLLAQKYNHCMIVVGKPSLKPTGLIVSPKNYHCRVVVGESKKINWICLWAQKKKWTIVKRL